MMNCFPNRQYEHCELEYDGRGPYRAYESCVFDPETAYECALDGYVRVIEGLEVDACDDDEDGDGDEGDEGCEGDEEGYGAGVVPDGYCAEDEEDCLGFGLI